MSLNSCTPEIPNGVRGLEVTMRSLCRLFVLVMVMGLSMAAWAKSDRAETSSAATPAARYAGAVDRIFEQEAKMVDSMRTYTPLVETYIQRMKPDNDLGTLPDKDRYFLGDRKSVV